VIRTKSRRITISPPRVEQSARATRVTAEVDGIPLWFESSDASLLPIPEAFGSAMLLASQHRARTLSFDSELSDAWLDNVSRLLKIWNSWWGYTPLEPRGRIRDDRAEPRSGTALLFSGGVDSFYSLISGARPDILVAVHGFDIRLDDSSRMSGLVNTLEAAADAYGC
jgi:hypothetical protein